MRERRSTSSPHSRGASWACAAASSSSGISSSAGLVCLAGGEHAVVRESEHEGLRDALVACEPGRRGADVLVPFGPGLPVEGCLMLTEAGEPLRDEDLDFALDVAGLCALAVERLQAARLSDEQKARIDSLLHAGRSITSSLVLQEVLDAVAREVVDALGARYCVIWEYDAGADALVERAGFSVDPGYSVDGDVIPLDERPREREILFSGEPVIETLSDPGLDAQSRESMERWGEKTCLSLPLRFGDATLGVLIVCETERERVFTPDELELARGLATQASAAVHNASMYRDLAERHDELEARSRRERLLNDLSVELSSSLDPRTVLDSACRRICELLGATGGEIWARCDGQQVECLASWAGGAFVEEWVGRRYPADHWAASSLAMDSGETLAIVSIDDPRLGDEERRVMREWDQRSLLAVPMKARGRTVGTVEVTQAGRERVFTEEEVATAESCARMTALAVDNALLFERQAGHARRLTSLLEASQALTSSLDLHDVLADARPDRGGVPRLSRGADLRVRPRRGHADHAFGAPGAADGVPGPRQAVLTGGVPVRPEGAGVRRTSSWSPSPTPRCPPTCASPWRSTGRRPASPCRCGSATARSACSPSSRRTPSACSAKPTWSSPAASPSRPPSRCTTPSCSRT